MEPLPLPESYHYQPSPESYYDICIFCFLWPIFLPGWAFILETTFRTLFSSPSSGTLLNKKRTAANIFARSFLQINLSLLYMYSIQFKYKVYFFLNGVCETRLFVLVLRAQSSCFTHGVRKSRACADQFDTRARRG